MTYRRILIALLAVGLLASLFVAVRRDRHERAARTVEIVMDDGDFAALAHAYAYDEAGLLAALRQAGLTSLAVSEELGTGISASAGGAVFAGSTLIDQAHLAPLSDPLFASLARAGRIRSDTMYLIAFDEPTASRYTQQLALKFDPRTVRVLRATLPRVWAIRTQADYFGGEGFGLPYDRMALAERLGLRLVPRLQNDETFTPSEIDAVVRLGAGRQRASDAIFFGLRNEVLGYPDNIPAAAAALQGRGLNFGTVESYDPKQDQLGNADLARRMPDHIVRVQAIARPEADKLSAEEIVQRYLLGVNERNIRVVYLRPWLHQWNGRSIAESNIEIVRRIAEGVRAGGKRLGSASPIGRFTIHPLVIAAASLAVPALLLLLLDLFGVGGPTLALVVVLADLALIALGVLVHRDLLVRAALALAAGIAFPVAGTLAVGWAFRDAPAPFGVRSVALRGLLALGLGIVVTLGGALTITGLLSTPLTMAEIDRFLGVKYVLFAPALIALLLYFLTDRFGAKVDLRTALDEPVRVVQLVLGLVLLGGAYVVLQRSGNQSDIAPSGAELALRAHLTTLLQVRPRFKEFAFAFPALVLVPALVPLDRTRFGWLFVLAVALGLGDVIDTFSHLHTPLRIGIERLGLGAVLGGLIGLVLVAVYRRLRAR